MKDQYVGDINDFCKYSLLRHLAKSTGFTLQVWWMLTGPDGSSQGSKLGYLEQAPRYRFRDPDVFDTLRRIVSGEFHLRGVQSVEEGGIFTGARFWRDLLPSDRIGRTTAVRTVLSELESGLLFLDPDNGLEVQSCPKGSRNSAKFLYLDEVAAFYQAGASLIIFQHYPREKRENYERRRALQLFGATGQREILGLKHANVVYFIVPQPEAAESLRSSAQEFGSKWSPFMTFMNLGSDLE